MPAQSLNQATYPFPTRLEEVYEFSSHGDRVSELASADKIQCLSRSTMKIVHSAPQRTSQLTDHSNISGAVHRSNLYVSTTKVPA
jgi:hypothetical protein